MNPRRFKPWPADRIEVVLFGMLLLAGLVLLAGCSTDQILPATREYAQEVAADNAARAAEGNPISALIHSLATLTAALAGAGILTKRAVKKFDDAPYTAEDLAALERAKKIAAIDGEPKA